MPVEFPLYKHDLAMGFTVFIGARLRYGKVVATSYPVLEPRTKYLHLTCYLVDLGVNGTDGLKMTLAPCIFSSRKL